MILISFDNQPRYQAKVVYDHHDRPIIWHPLAKMLKSMTRTEALGYAKMRGWGVMDLRKGVM